MASITRTPRTPAKSSPHVSAASLAILEKIHQSRDEDRPFLPADLQGADGYADTWGKPAFAEIPVPADNPLLASRTLPCTTFSLYNSTPRLVRADHREMINGFEWLRKKKLAKGGVIWGQPGNGKSCSLEIVMSFCAERKIPFVFHRLGHEVALVVIETDQGGRVYIISPSMFGDIQFTVLNYVLFDAGAHQVGVPALYAHSAIAPSSFVLLASSPQPGRYKDFAKERGARFFTVELLSREEVLAFDAVRTIGLSLPAMSVASVPFDSLALDIPSGIPFGGYTDEQIEADTSPLTIEVDGLPAWSLLTKYHYRGSNYRRVEQFEMVSTGIAATGDPVADLLPQIKQPLSDPHAIKELLGGNDVIPHAMEGHHAVFSYAPKNSATPPSAFPALANLSLNFSITRFSTSPTFTVSLTSPFLRDRILQELNSLDHQRRVDLLAAVEGTGSLHGIVYEAFVLRSLVNLTRLTLVDPPPPNTNPASLTPLRLSPSSPHSTEVVLSLPNNMSRWYPRKELAPIETGIYPLRPANFAAADCLIASPEPSSTAPPTSLVYAVLQITVAGVHTALDDGVNALRDRLDVADQKLAAANQMGSKRYWVFLAPDAKRGIKLAQHWHGKIPGFEVMYAVIESSIASQ
ncbi:hypothetical protein JCM10213v2_000506 [Rhodosporidiobolus nylandii]